MPRPYDDVRRCESVSEAPREQARRGPRDEQIPRAHRPAFHDCVGVHELQRDEAKHAQVDPVAADDVVEDVPGSVLVREHQHSQQQDEPEDELQSHGFASLCAANVVAAVVVGYVLPLTPGPASRFTDATHTSLPGSKAHWMARVVVSKGPLSSSALAAFVIQTPAPAPTPAPVMDEGWSVVFFGNPFSFPNA